ncbi:alpha/beta hydrolase family esterase [Candidatus Frankia alpina]|uniref:alpha/beta hydrolase family esterase n=1 Tax=Candidatus Frankia alpina TaxID=2699483 RepID=UPI001F1A0CD5|nr:PHB depolymerase family esterase [Candidatus Frankia alpina]
MLRWARVGLPRRGRLLRGVGIVAVVAIGLATLVLAAMSPLSSASANAASVTSATTATAGPSAGAAHVAGPSAIAAAPTASTPVAAPQLPAATGLPAAGSPTASGLVTAPGAATSGAPPAAASAPPAQPVDTVHRLPSGRTYQLHADVRLSPTFRGTARPLVILLHGLLNSPENMREMSGADPFADTYGFAVAYGVGVHEAWNAGGCCGQATTDDVGYLRQLVDDAASHTPVDRSRVYVWGFSNGAMLAARVACEAPDLVAAVGVVGGQAMVPCPTIPVRLLHIHGTADMTVPWRGGWSDYLKMNLPDGETEATRFAPGSEIRHLTWDGGHTWPWWATGALWDFSAPISLDSALPDTTTPPTTTTSSSATSSSATSPGNTAIPGTSASLSASTTPTGPTTTTATTSAATTSGATEVLVAPDEGP